MKFSVFHQPGQLRALNPFWVVLASPILAGIYTHLGNKGKDLSMPMKFTLGMFMCSLGFDGCSCGMWFADAQADIAMVYRAGVLIPELR